MIDQLKEDILKAFADESEERQAFVRAAFDDVEKKTLRSLMKARRVRIDGRGFDDIRTIDCQTGILPRTHGSALFTRGETQALATPTLGTPRAEQRVETLLGETTKSFMLHYSFPPFFSGRGQDAQRPRRREIVTGTCREGIEQDPARCGVFPYPKACF
jgi:polyribonucleotide nucleotidyltransferase